MWQHKRALPPLAEAGYVIPSPGITFKASLTVHYGVKGS